MKSLLAIGASALAMGLASVGGAQAQATIPTGAVLPSVSAVIGDALITLQRESLNGNWVNEAYNIGDVDGSVTLGQVGVKTRTAVDLPRLQAKLEGSGAGAAVLPPPAAAVGAAAEGAIDLDLGAIETTLETIGGIASADKITTTALGAVNTGNIASIATSSTNRATNQTTNTTFEVTSSISSASGSAANTSNTAASAAAASSGSLSITGPTTTVNQTLEQLASGPLTDVYALNRAYNAADINGRVLATANDMALGGIETTALGAVNTGNISMGFDGSAFVRDNITGQ